MSILRPGEKADCAELNSTCISEQTARQEVATVESCSDAGRPSSLLRYCTAMSQMIPPGQALRLSDLIVPTPDGIASRVLGKTSGGNLTLFALDAGQGLTEHTSPFEALVIVLEGTCTLTIGGTAVRATPGTIVRMPADIPHALEAVEATRLLLVLLRDTNVRRFWLAFTAVIVLSFAVLGWTGVRHLSAGSARARTRRHHRRATGDRHRTTSSTARTSGSRWGAWRSAPSGVTAATSRRIGPPTGCIVKPCSSSTAGAVRPEGFASLPAERQAELQSRLTATPPAEYLRSRVADC